MSKKNNHSGNVRYEKNTGKKGTPKQQSFYNIDYIEESKRIQKKKNMMGNSVGYTAGSEEMEYPEYGQSSMAAGEIEYTEDNGYQDYQDQGQTVGQDAQYGDYESAEYQDYSQDVQYENYEDAEYQGYSEDVQYENYVDTGGQDYSQGVDYNGSAVYEDYTENTEYNDYSSGNAAYENYDDGIRYTNYRGNVNNGNANNGNKKRSSTNKNSTSKGNTNKGNASRSNSSKGNVNRSNLNRNNNANRSNVQQNSTSQSSVKPRKKPQYTESNEYEWADSPNVRQPRHGKHRKRSNPVRFLIPVFVCVVMIVLFGVGSQVYADSKVYKVCRVEAGVSVSPSDFMKNGDEKAVFAKDSEPFNIAQPGKYRIRVKSGSSTYSCTLIIQDTIAPKAQPEQAIVEVGKSCEAEKLVKNIEDATLVTVSYVEAPDFSKVGVQPVKVVLTDRGNNQTIVESELMVSVVAASVTVEAGGNPPDLQSFVNGATNAEFITPVRVFDFTKVGDHRVSISVDGKTYVSILHIVDTVPPEAEVQDIESYALLPIEAEEFVTEMTDVTEVKVTYGEEPDWTQIGAQDVEIILTDSGNNRTVKNAKLTLQKDTEPPSIEGAVDLKAFVGDTVSYRKNVSVTDNCPECELSVNTSEVDLNTAGVYSVVYTATDLAGNATSVTVKLTVSAREYSLESVNALADKVLADIIKPGMTEEEKVRAIYNYNMSHIGYVNDSEKDDYVKAAYQGLSEGRGDCFVYASTAKILLTRAGITNMDIEKIPAATLHYWNLVDIGDGWYHFDTTPRKDHPTIFMWTDEQLMDYSEKHNKSHNYDHSLYPEVN